ncbi:hypothetical protein [Fulvivirga lutimaris]|uniref:hypothetical protein n=1 Tax=Fulvivirga lutimaris TaxID=1819566 RepID=UPI0012BD015E|nr:hypothetical protein [Fulvivirga lutimaris]MTI38532.1 hypothetical protein [Fulvivirga lutimaris]
MISRTYVTLTLLLVLPYNSIAQVYTYLPEIDGDLENWHNSIAKNLKPPFMQGSYYFIDELEKMSASQNPFYKDNWSENGTISYEGRIYSGINMIYNISKDVLLIWSYEMSKNNIKSLLINQTKIDSFNVHNEMFLRHDLAEIGVEGFYRKVMKGRHLSCFAKEKKTGELKDSRYEYRYDRQYLIKFKNEIYKYRGMSTIYKILPNHKKQIKKYMRQEGIVMRKKNEVLLKNILSYCDNIVL